MAELNVGSIYATLELKTQQVNQAAADAIKTIRGVGIAAGQIPTSIQEEKIIAKIQKANSAYEEQRRTVGRLNEAVDEYIKSVEQMSHGLASGSRSSIDVAMQSNPKLFAELEKEEAKLGDLKHSLDSLTREREQAAQKAVAAAQKQAAATETATQSQTKLNQQMGDKTAAANMRVGTNIAISGLRTLAITANGTAGGIADIITQVVMMREAMQSAASAGATWGAAIAGVVGIAASLIVKGIEQIKQAEEERQQRFAEAIENTKQYAEELASIERNVRVMNDATSTTEEVTQAKNELASSLDGVVVGYDKEGNAILASNKLLDKQIEKLKETIRLENEVAASGYLTELQNYKNMEDERNQKASVYMKSIDDLKRQQILRPDLDYSESIDKWMGEISKLDAALLSQQQTVSEAFLSKFKTIYEGFYDLPSEYQNTIEAIVLENEEVMRSEDGLAQMMELVNAQLENRVASDSYISQLEKMSEAAGEVESGFNDHMTAINELASAYQTLQDGQALSAETLYSLAAAYPEINQYLQESGDLTLKGGEIVEQVYAIKANAYENERIQMLETLKAQEETLQAELQILNAKAQSYDALADAAGNAAMKERDATYAALSDTREAIAALQASLTATNSFSLSGSKKTSGSSRNEALQNELKLLEHRKKMNQLTYEEELSWLNRLMKQYRMSADERQDLEYRIYQVKQKMHEEEEKALQEQIDMLDDLGSAMITALKARYEEQKKIEQDRINESIESWQKWEDETVAAIQGQIDALDDLEKQQESEDKRAEYERNKQALELQKAYEKDLYQREMIQKEINRLDAEEQKRLEQEARDQLREQLQDQIDAVREESSAKQDALKEELDKLDETYAELTSTAALTAEAEKTIMQSSQEEILQLLQSYAPDYEVAGQSLGEKLVQGFQSKVGSIEAFFDNLQSRMTAFQNQVAAVANQAADNFWASRAAEEARIASQAAPANVSMTVNFNQPVESPIEMRRELEKVMQSMAAKIQLGG